ncbi:MAG TPA: hypothetical protein DCL49_06620 [Candidatus Omnitrophica bacterium]|nr:hypothetical protein [Candidatus Omnitrophota bacterium]HBG64273.1 hypothetical protein [Candidatus Omnitrophota bacterium]HCD37239.1 hypothetical protein [Candidatus Omnitrophota bacterium]
MTVCSLWCIAESYKLYAMRYQLNRRWLLFKSLSE